MLFQVKLMSFGYLEDDFKVEWGTVSKEAGEVAIKSLKSAVKAH